MIILIGGSTHTGKTVLAQRLIEKYHYAAMSLDHLKMGLIRSGRTNLTVEDDEQMTELLWPIVKEMIKTAIENDQNMIIEGCYFPYDWKKDFEEVYAEHIRMFFLVMTPRYIEEHFDTIKQYANVIEKRLDDTWYDKALLIKENNICLERCQTYGCDYVLIDEAYSVISEFIGDKLK